MPAPATVEQFVQLLHKSGLVDEKALADFLDSRAPATPLPGTPRHLAGVMVRAGLLTKFQSEQLLLGKSKGFLINGKYRLLEHLGTGGMGSVYLCEHTSMRRLVAIKVLPMTQVKDSSYLERFYREARAVAALDHPNIVRAHDIDCDGKMHFLVMEYVDGSSLQDIVTHHGPLDIRRAAHYMSQAAAGLQHAHEAGLVHRDVKPGNLLVDRSGTVKVLDLGLARFFNEDDGLSRKFDETVLGTTDYLAPEQSLDSKVDIRADIYSLGATFYYCLTGHTLFGDGGVSQKLMWQQVRKPKPIHTHRPEVPEELVVLIEERMLAKEAAGRFQVPAEVCAALTPWTAEPVPPPPEEEMPHLCAAAQLSNRDSRPPTPPPSPRPSRGLSRTRVVRPGSSRSPSRAGAAVQDELTPASVPASRAKAKAKSASKGAAPRGYTTDPEPVTPLQRLQVLLRRWPIEGRRNNYLAGGAALLVLLLATFGLRATFSGSTAPVKTEIRPPAPVAATVAAAPAKDDVLVVEENGSYRVRTPSYDVSLGPDGNLTSLRIAGAEFLKNDLRFGNNVARGTYFFYDKDGGPGVVKLPTIERQGHNVLKASGDRFSVVYEFRPDSLSLKLNNATDHTVPFFAIFDTSVYAVRNEQGDKPVATPATRPWPTTTWFTKGASLSITGGSKIWGPFMGSYQVWEASLKTYETCQVVFTAGTAVLAEVPAPNVTLVSFHRIRKPGYEATVEEDGCLTSLRIEGVEFFRPGIDVSRGLYLHNGKHNLRLPEIASPAADVVVAKGPEAELRYEFGAEAITCTATNKSEKVLAFFIVMDRAVEALLDGAGGWAKSPTAIPPAQAADKRYETTAWFAGAARLQLVGGSRVWGPWSAGKLQVWEAVLNPKESRRVVMQPGRASTAELAKLRELLGRAVAQVDLRLDAPLDYQVFQRQSRLEGKIHLRGRSHVPCDKVEVRLVGTSLKGKLADKWQEIPLTQPTGSFDHALPAEAGGWYSAEVRALKDGKVVAQANVAHVGVGEVFVGAGQSNSTNCGQERIQPVTGMISTFDGYTWRTAEDPQPGVHDQTNGGSYWPAFGDAMYERYHVPIGIASAGHSGTSVNQWQPDGELFRWMLTRIQQLGPKGFRGLQWHQGESDVGMSADEYARRLTTVIRASHVAAGWEFPWFVARVSYHNPQNPSFPTTRDGQKKLWDTGVALEGPDTDLLMGDNRDEGGRGIHFSPKGLRAHGRMWAEKVAVYLDRVLGP